RSVLSFWQGVDDAELDAPLGKSECRCQAGRAGAHDKDVGREGGHGADSGSAALPAASSIGGRFLMARDGPTRPRFTHVREMTANFRHLDTQASIIRKDQGDTLRLAGDGQKIEKLVPLIQI